ncbi:MAG: hypothetical protein Q7T49_01740 [bacterium]|nr:hypothetical protein [bacterium]
MSKRLINILTLVLVIIALYYGYRYFLVAPAVPEVPGVAVTTGEVSGSTSGEFLDLLLSVKNISLTKALFENPIFRDRLQDFGRELPERVIGRENPFAPFGVGGTGTTTTSQPKLATSTASTTITTTATTTPKNTPKKTTASTTPATNFNF